MQNRRRLAVGLVLALLVLALPACTSTDAVPQAAPVTDFPPRNPYLADSDISIFHNNAGQTGATMLPGPVGTTQRIADTDIIWKQLGPAADAYSYQYSGVYPDGRRVGWFGGYQHLVKLDADTLDTLSTYVLHPGSYLSAEEIERRFAKADRLEGQPLFDVLVPDFVKSLEEGAQGVYRLLTRDNKLFMLDTDRATGDQYIRRFGDAVKDDPASAIVLEDQVKLEGSNGERLSAMSMNITYDGWLIVVTRSGLVFAVSRDFKTVSTLQLPLPANVRGPAPKQKSDGSVSSANEAANAGIVNGFVRNGMAIDPDGGIFIVTRDRLYRVRWTGSRLSLDEGDGAWSETYRSGAFGSGTTPALIGFHPGQDKMVVIGDGESNVEIFWRERLPADWQGLPEHPRRLAGLLPIRFSDDPAAQKVMLENAMVTMGYGVMVANDTPEHEVPWQGSKLANKVAERYAGQTGGTEIKGGVKWQWDPKTRRFEQAWTTPLALAASLCGPNVNGLLYCMGSRDGISTIEVLDWDSGAPVFHYELGKSYRYTTIGAVIAISPGGDIECGCGGGYGLIRVRPPHAHRPRVAAPVGQ